MSELSDALRQFADRIEDGKEMADATQCALVLSNNAGQCKATYIGRMVPATTAGIQLLAVGIQNMNASASSGGFQATRGSTH